MVAKGKKAAVNRCGDVAAAGNSASGNGVGKGKLLGNARVSTADQDLTI